MPILIEDMTVVVRREILDRKWPGGANAFLEIIPNASRCDDGALVGASFDKFGDANRLLGQLQDAGFEVCTRGEWRDAAMVLQRSLPERWCAWLELALVELYPGARVLAARTESSTSTDIAVPQGWTYAESRTRRSGLHPLPPSERPLRFLRREPSAVVYLDRFSGEEVRVKIPDPPVLVTVERADGTRCGVTADLVRTWDAIDLGLMHRDNLAPGTGMLFMFDDPFPGTFWMKNTRIPLDMVFANELGTIVDLCARAQPMSLEPSGSGLPCRMVLEVGAGWIEEHGVRLGDRLCVVHETGTK